MVEIKNGKSLGMYSRIDKVVLMPLQLDRFWEFQSENDEIKVSDDEYGKLAYRLRELSNFY